MLRLLIILCPFHWSVFHLEELQHGRAGHTTGQQKASASASYWDADTPVSDKERVSASALGVPPTPRGAADWIKCKWGKLAGRGILLVVEY